MKKIFAVVIVLFAFVSAQGRYVLTTKIGEKGELKWHSYVKGYALEQKIEQVIP